MVNPHHEIIAVVDDNDNQVGEANIVEVHKNGLLHREICSYVINAKNEALLQKRTDTLKWDHSSAGHFSPKESYEQGLVREFGEELGIRLPLFEFKLIAKDKYKRAWLDRQNYKFVQIYVVRKDIPLEQFKPDPSEVVEVAYYSSDELKRLLAQPEKITSDAIYILEKYILPLINKIKNN